ncbi:Hypothetical predicted protein [Pelobates cultripes]|uniref:Uncharacterized protein n=1 Tax=Pelobates cultripes TaxID=61616 RepID=A0AAD1VL33_PELCU|nr:Hypothetical predicted protein [Pelobates cultripes]
MVRSKKPHAQGGSPHHHTGTLDDYMSTPSTQGTSRPPDNMGPESPSQESAGGSLLDSAQDDTLLTLEAFYKSSGQRLERTVEVRVEALETEAQARRMQRQAAELATTRQGSLILSLRQQEELENRSRRQNIRIRGLPEPDTAPLAETLKALFQQILGRECPEEIQLDRAHLTLGLQRPYGRPWNVLCCLHAYSLKEKLMAASSRSESIVFRGAEVVFYQDLSGLTLDARRTRRPLTATLRDKSIPHRWGFPFSLQVKQGNSWLHVRWPDDVPRVVRAFHLPSLHIRNWLLDTPLAP